MLISGSGERRSSLIVPGLAFSVSRSSAHGLNHLLLAEGDFARLRRDPCPEAAGIGWMSAKGSTAPSQVSIGVWGHPKPGSGGSCILGAVHIGISGIYKKVSKVS